MISFLKGDGKFILWLEAEHKICTSFQEVLSVPIWTGIDQWVVYEALISLHAGNPKWLTEGSTTSIIGLCI